jgi:hypothetical protein
MTVRIMGVTAVLGLLLPLGGAIADPSAPGFDGVISSGVEITDYLCQAKHVEDLHKIADDARRQYDDADARVKALQDQIDKSRATIDPDNAEQVDAFRRLLNAKNQEEIKLFSVAAPYSRATAQSYNAAAASYSRAWTGKQFDPDALARFQATLVCSNEPVVTAQPLP